jgi:FMN phosphatase YigB (HAD superfamily)
VTLTLLLDLDDTLLTNNMEAFLPAYFRALASYMTPHALPRDFIATLTASAGAMIANDFPNRTLKETFDAAFYPTLGLDARQIRDSIENFYQEIFPTLQPLTTPRPEAIQLIEDSLKRDFQLVIATNPLFPKSAIEERVSWAGISPQDYPISLITSYETFHFSKPNPAYYAEILARLGWPEVAIVMVGDDLENDIKPAQKLGIATFWIKPDNPFIFEKQNSPPCVSGWLDQIIPWIDNTPIDQLQPTINNQEAYLAVLKSTPACLASILAEIPISAWRKSPFEGEWCLTEIICHLRDVEREVNLPRLAKIIEETNPFLPGMDTDRWAKERQYINQDGPIALDEFIQARLELLELISKLNHDDWIQPARHAIFGPTQLIELVDINANHDRMHIQQVHQVLNALNK